MKNNNQHHKNLLEVLLSEVPCLEFLLSLQKSSKVSIKKMITEVLLLLPLYLILFLIWWRFRHLIKIMADVENILNDDDFFGDTPKEDIEQHRKRYCLKSVFIR